MKSGPMMDKWTYANRNIQSAMEKARENSTLACAIVSKMRAYLDQLLFVVIESNGVL